MNKDEIQHKLEQAVKDVAKLQVEVEVLEMQLAKVKKPKPRHGDFGYGTTGGPRIALSHNFGFVTAGDGSLYDHEYEDYNPNPVLGNIFDLLKEWSEDLTFFEFDVHRCEINTKDFAHAPIHIAGNWHTSAEAEEIWHKLGRVIATFKRKENK